VQRRQDHLERAQVFEFWVRIDRDATAIVAHRQPVALLDRDLDKTGMTGDRLIHRVVEDFRRQVMQRRLIGAADIHAGALTHRFQTLQDLDVLGRVFRVVTRRQGQASLRLGLHGGRGWLGRLFRAGLL
jgi:hypothetical protein